MILVTADEMREMDRRTIEEVGIPGRVLMEKAGSGATRFLCRRFPDLARMNVGVAAGRGNNGGDGSVIARYLANRGIAVTVYLLADRSQVAGDAAANLDLLGPLGVPVVEIQDEKSFAELRTAMRSKDLWVDAILGTGLNSDVRGIYRRVIDFINSLRKPVFAVDVPSGLHSDTGQLCGTCLRASATATFGFAKTGQQLYPGVAVTGDLEVVDIGIPRAVVEEVRPRQHLLTREHVQRCLPARPDDSHKGQTGHLLVVAGSPGKTGAAAMTATSALRAGAGLVTVAVAQSLNSILEILLLEAMTEPLPEEGNGILGESCFDRILQLLSGKRCLAIGPGLGQRPATGKLILRLIADCGVPMVIDADGLNHLSADTDVLRKATSPVILTPHPGEMARLTGKTSTEVQSDRIRAAREFAQGFGVHVVLKGARTAVAHPDGGVFINPTGNAGMASGGMGDVLTGLIAGFLAQGLSAEAAAQSGVYLHGAAADTLAEAMGPIGYLASEVMDAIPSQVRRILTDELL
jgi:NAD(P)H-hydrate epimerase